MDKEILEVLQRPFEKGQIKQRKGRSNAKFSYVEAHTVIERLNEAFSGNWSFEVVSHEKAGSEFIVLGRLTVWQDGSEVSKMQFGGKEIEVYSRGDRAGEVISLSDNIKAATSDCLKKCATLFGIGLDLYSDGGGSAGGSDTASGGSGNGAPNGDKPGTVGDIKNRILAGEKKINELSEQTVADLRGEHLGSQSLNHPKPKLQEYLDFLLKEYREAKKNGSQNGKS